MELLRPGDHIRVIAPAGRVNPARFEPSKAILESWGLQVEISDQVLRGEGYFAGSDLERLNALQAALDDRQCKAIFCARGGYGTTRILELADYAGFLQFPKWLIGFSDITALHLKLSKLGIPSIHGAMPVQYGDPGQESSLESLRKCLFNGEYSYRFEEEKDNRRGMARGILSGGNLALLADSLATPTDIETGGRILFLEEIGEDIYRVDRMLHQLKRAGKFEDLAGLIIGQFTNIRDTDPSFGATLEELVRDVMPPDIPIAFNFPAGHESPNLALMLGKEHELSVDETCSLSLGSNSL